MIEASAKNIAIVLEKCIYNFYHCYDKYSYYVFGI